MISLISEMTDAKGRRARAGWVFFDGDCSFCMGLARRFRSLLESRGFGLATLQDPRARQQLGLPADQVLLEMKVLTAEGEQFGGADAILYLARSIPWAWPLYAAARVPAAREFLRAVYRWVAVRRHCPSGRCSRPQAFVHVPADSLEGGDRNDAG
jgi:predicted DCC family thiol-disulfide oxidoreductase YuxK